LIRYITYNEIDKHKWDECIHHAVNGIVYAYSWYLDIVSPSWDALVENDYERVFPLTKNKKSGISYLFQPFFTQQLGIFSTTKLNAEITENFISKIPHKFKFAEINLNTFNKIEPAKFQVFPNLTHELDLIPTYDLIYRNYSENTRRNIKLALNSELIISQNTKAEQVIELFKNNKGKDIETLKEKEYLLLKKLISVCLYKKIAHISGVYTKEANLCAGAIFIESNNKVIFLFSATDNEARSNGAMSFLIDSFIKYNSQRNLTLDFEGSNDPNLARFYRSFGAKECVYFQYKKDELPWILSKSVTFIKWLRNKF
jgi:hypothetical protein